MKDIKATALNRYELGVIVGADDRTAIPALLAHIKALEDLLDLGDQEDAFGTEGWRHRLGIEK